MRIKNCIICDGKKYDTDLSFGFDRCMVCLGKMMRGKEMIEDFCEEEQIVGSTTVYCLFKAGHDGDCVFADPRIIEKCAKKNDEIHTEFRN